ncbi:MAG: reverse transcriptase/maturase family protein [Schwartzia sp.]|nr:reverse transcriptase/maturase family protein [Schwartzia sp. (in: firmicutes)]
MKRHGNLFEKIVAVENIELAFEKARQGKNWQDTVKEVERNREKKLEALRQRLISGSFRTSDYKVKIIHEPKERQIFILPFYPDRIVQHAIMNVVAPLWESMFIYDSYACRKGKGQHAGSKRCMQFVRRNAWVCQFDISKFYPSIPHDKLMDVIRRKIKDEKVIALLSNIVTSIGSERNVPIGNYTSQWFGNLYLNELDQLVKHKYHVRDYLRYCDDFLIFGNDKEELKRIANEVESFVGGVLQLRLSKKELYPTSHGVDFLGYRHFPSGKILVRKSTAKRIKKRLKAVPWEIKHGKINKEQAIGKIASAHGWLKHANAHHLRLAIKFDDLKNEVEAMP